MYLKIFYTAFIIAVTSAVVWWIHPDGRDLEISVEPKFREGLPARLEVNFEGMDSYKSLLDQLDIEKSLNKKLTGKISELKDRIVYLENLPPTEVIVWKERIPAWLIRRGIMNIDLPGDDLELDIFDLGPALEGQERMATIVTWRRENIGPEFRVTVLQDPELTKPSDWIRLDVKRNLTDLGPVIAGYDLELGVFLAAQARISRLHVLAQGTDRGLSGRAWIVLFDL